MSDRQISVAVVGLGFGENFVPIYLSHPNVHEVVLVDPDMERLNAVGDRYGALSRFRSLDALLASDKCDAVHLATPVHLHAEQSIATLVSARHCACAVPMATSVDDLNAIVAAQAASSKNYMMMETSVYSREFLFVDRLFRRGELGALSFYRGFHMQDLDGYPPYWLGFPPMLYNTHALAPILALTDSCVETVSCFGSGKLTDERRGDSGNPFPVETGLFRLSNSELTAEITVSFFQVARRYIEGFSVYGESSSVEWSQVGDGELLVMDMQPLSAGSRGRHGGRLVDFERVTVPNDTHSLPPQLAEFTLESMFEPRGGASPVVVPSGHGGSHPHLVHEFVRSIVEERQPAIDSVTAANWCAPGIVAHDSALAGGAVSNVPRFGPR